MFTLPLCCIDIQLVVVGTTRLLYNRPSRGLLAPWGSAFGFAFLSPDRSYPFGCPVPHLSLVTARGVILARSI